MSINRVNDRLLNANGERASNLCEPRISSIPVPSDNKIPFPEVHVWRMKNGKVIEFCEYQGDEQREDGFWS